jgi:hypothetical protein
LQPAREMAGLVIRDTECGVSADYPRAGDDQEDQKKRNGVALQKRFESVFPESGVRRPG